MTPSLLFTAAFLISGNPDTPEPVPSEAEWVGLSKALNEVAADWELTDRHNAWFYKKEHYPNDIRMLRERRAAGEVLPLMADAKRFDSYEHYGKGSQLNRCYIRDLETRAMWELDLYYPIQEIIRVANHRRAIWDAAEMAQSPYRSIWDKRNALGVLKQSLTPEEWTAGRLPLPIP